MTPLQAANSSAANNSGADHRLILTLLTMTLVTGFVDAVSFLGAGHVFTGNMTGNVVLLGFALAGAPRLSIARSVTSLFAFLLGAVLGGRLGLTFTATRSRQWVLRVGACEAALLFTAALVSVGVILDSGVAGGRIYAVIVLTAVAMGFRTAAARRLAAVDVRTTVLTSTLAALAGDSILAGGDNHHMGRRAGSVLSMLSGAAIGAVLLRFGLAVPLGVGGVLVLASTCAYAWLSPPTAARASGEEN